MNPDVQPPVPGGRRLAGVALHFTSLPGPFGIGDIADGALAFLGTLAEMGLGVWQFLPTGPTGYGDSPYQLLSAFAGNEMLVGVGPLLREGLVGEDEADRLRSLPSGHVDYGRLIPVKTALLAAAADRFRDRARGEARLAYEEFLHANDGAWLDDYALFRTLKSLHEELPWPEWDCPHARRDPGALRRARDAHRDALERTKVIQFLFDRQWRALHRHAREMDICLFADMPIYIALDSADAWARPEMLRLDADGRPTHVAGVPPDYFSADGQLWGTPLYNWARHRASGFSWWIDRLRHALEMADLVRIDHFRGFESYWSVPAGEPTARHGRWERGPGDALFDALEAALGRLPVVAENLGVITPKVEALRRRHGIPGMHVLQFRIGEPGFEPKAIEENSVCYTGTHDNDTTVGWFRGGGHDTRTSQEIEATRKAALKLTGGTEQTIHEDLVGLALGTRADIAIAPMQDYLGLGTEARLNTPGTTHGNWRWRLLEAQLTEGFRERVNQLVRKHLRG